MGDKFNAILHINVFQKKVDENVIKASCSVYNDSASLLIPQDLPYAKYSEVCLFMSVPVFPPFFYITKHFNKSDKTLNFKCSRSTVAVLHYIIIISFFYLPVRKGI